MLVAIYTPGWRGACWDKSVVLENTTQSTGQVCSPDFTVIIANQLCVSLWVFFFYQLSMTLPQIPFLMKSYVGSRHHPEFEGEKSLKWPLLQHQILFLIVKERQGNMEGESGILPVVTWGFFHSSLYIILYIMNKNCLESVSICLFKLHIESTNLLIFSMCLCFSDLFLCPFFW